MPPTTLVFIDNLNHQLVRVDDIHITLCLDSNLHRLSPGEFDLGHFMFGTMLDLTMTPSTRSSTTIWHRLPTYITLDADNRIHDFATLPREMLHFTFGAAITRPLLVAARQATRVVHRQSPLLLRVHADMHKGEHHHL